MFGQCRLTELFCCKMIRRDTEKTLFPPVGVSTRVGDLIVTNTERRQPQGHVSSAQPLKQDMMCATHTHTHT